MKKFMLRRVGVNNEPGSQKPSLQECLDIVLDQSDVLMDEVLMGLQLSLSPMKNKAQRLQPNGAAKAAIDSLGVNKAAVKQSFSKALRAAVYGGEALRKHEQPLVRFEDFQFLEEEQIDANIELALTQQEVLLAVDDVLPLINGMISSMMGWVTVQGHLNPLKPDSFVYALRECFVEQIPSEEVRSTLMTPAAGMLGVALRQLYKEVGEWLRALGVEPVAAANAGGRLGGAKKPDENPVTRTMLTLDKLRRLLSGDLAQSVLSSSGVLDFSHTVPASYVALEDLQLMEPMMKRLSKRAAEATPAATEQSGASGSQFVMREQTKSKKLGRQLGEEVVRLMLESLMQDHRLLPGVRANLKALEPVLLALSQTDARFFSERKHPARQFLDKMTSRSLAFTSENEPGYGRFQKVFDNAVGVLVGGEGDAATFARILRKLEEGWAIEEQEQRQRAEEAARGLMRAEQRNLLAQRLTEDFTERMQDKKIPEIVVNFLRGPWAQVAAESQLSCTDGTVDADGYMALADDLIWSVQLRLARRNRARLVEIVPSMLVTMRQGLNLISYPPERIPVFFDALITYHEKAFEGARPVPPPAPGEVPIAQTAAELEAFEPDSPGVDPDAFWMGEDEAAESGFLADDQVLPDMPDLEEVPNPVDQQAWSVESLNTGSWVDLALGGVWVRAQLTWASPHRTLFMFISAGGMAHSMSKRTMDRLRGLGLIRLVSDGRVMDNALDAVAQAALRNDVGKAAGGG
jgi:hypothetical protein